MAAVPTRTSIGAKACAAAAIILKTSAQTGIGVPGSSTPSRYGTTIEHYHLPLCRHRHIQLDIRRPRPLGQLRRTKRLRETSPAFAELVFRVTAMKEPWARTDEDRNMQNLLYSLKQICRHNRDGSYKTQADRERILLMIGRQLNEMGYRMNQAGSLRTKHIEVLVRRWKEEALSPGSIKNRMSALRWVAGKINKQNIVARTNEAYGIAERCFVTNEDKGRDLTSGDLAAVEDPFTQMSLRLQAEFGLRREESIKFQPGFADRGDRLVLKPSWTKGGRVREIPIRTEEQRQLVDEAKVLAAMTPRGSLIMRDTYVEQLHVFKYQCAKAGIHHVHGHRHRYAQRRYQELTGSPCPALGGRRARYLTDDAKAHDRAARLQISAELGHGRAHVTAVYLGS